MPPKIPPKDPKGNSIADGRVPPPSLRPEKTPSRATTHDGPDLAAPSPATPANDSLIRGDLPSISERAASATPPRLSTGQVATSFPHRLAASQQVFSAPLPCNHGKKFESRLEYVLANDFGVFDLKASEWIALMDVRVRRLPPNHPQIHGPSTGGPISESNVINHNSGLRELMISGFYWFSEDLTPSARDLSFSDITNAGFDPHSLSYGREYYLKSKPTISAEGKIAIEWEMQLKIFAPSKETLNALHADLSDQLIIDKIVAVRGWNEEHRLVYLHDYANCVPPFCERVAIERNPRRIESGSHPGSTKWWRGENRDGNFNHVLDLSNGGDNAQKLELRGFFPSEGIPGVGNITATDSRGPRPVQGCRTLRQMEPLGMALLRKRHPKIAENMWKIDL